MDAEGIERAGLINYVSPDVIGFDGGVNAWAARYAAADPSRLIAFGSIDPRTLTESGRRSIGCWRWASAR